MGAHLDDDELVGAFADDESELVPTLAPLTVRQTVTVMQHWKARLAPEHDEDEPAEQEREVFLSSTLGGRYRLDGNLDAVGGNVVDTALRLAGADDFDPDRIPARRRTDALVDVMQFFLDHHQRTPGSRHRPHVNVVVDIDHVGDHLGARSSTAPRSTPPARRSCATASCRG